MCNRRWKGETFIPYIMKNNPPKWSNIWKIEWSTVPNYIHNFHKILPRYEISRLHAKNFRHTKVRPFLGHSCAILSSFKIVVIFNIIKTNPVDVVLKMTTILKELRIAQLCSKNEQTLGK